MSEEAPGGRGNKIVSVLFRIFGDWNLIRSTTIMVTRKYPEGMQEMTNVSKMRTSGALPAILLGVLCVVQPGIVQRQRQACPWTEAAWRET